MYDSAFDMMSHERQGRLGISFRAHLNYKLRHSVLQYTVKKLSDIPVQNSPWEGIIKF